MDLDKRMKRYETSYNIQLPPRGYIIIRLDGKGFSKYTKQLDKPFDLDFSEAMNRTTETLCEYFSPKLAYTQSDEISLLLTDIENVDAQMIYDGKVQKISSISASIATAKFNQERILDILGDKITYDGVKDFNFAHFDSRVFLIPDYREVYNYFVWRQKDCTRNSISMAHHAIFGHNKGKNKSSSQKQDDLMLDAKINWNDYPIKFKRGVVVSKQIYQKTVNVPQRGEIVVERKRWETDYETPIFTKNPEYLHDLIPIVGEKV